MKRACRLVVLCAAFVFGTALFAAGNGFAAEAEANYAWLMENNADFAAMEQEFGEARAAFLASLPEAIRPVAERFLTSEESWDFAGQWTGYRNHVTPDFLDRTREDRERLFAYMERVVGTSFDDPGYAALIRPVFIGFERYTRQNAAAAVERALEDYETVHADSGALPARYQFRVVDGKRWALILEDSAAFSTSGYDSMAGYVMRENDGGWSVHPLIAPLGESFFPSTGALPRFEQHSPVGYLATPEPLVRAEALPGDGPFAIRLVYLPMDQTIKGSYGNMPYRLVPECSNFPYTWSEISATYLRGAGVCKPEGEWGAFSPFENGELVAVRQYRRELMQTDNDLKRREDALNFTWDAFSALFDGKLANFVKAEFAVWRLERDFRLFRHIGAPEAFAATSAEITQPVVDWMQLVFAALAQPDVSIPFLLDPLHAAWQRDKDTSENDLTDRRNSMFAHYLRYDDSPWLSAIAAGQLRVLKSLGQGTVGRAAFLSPGFDEASDKAYYDRPEAHMWQFNGKFAATVDGDTMTVRYADRDTNRAKESTAYISIFHNQGESWGVTDSGRLQEDSEENAPAQRITRIRGGVITFVTPELPEEGDFFSTGAAIWPSGGECTMEPTLQGAMTDGHFTLNAVLRHVGSPYDVEDALCVPECAIPYVWNGSAFEPGEPVCLPEGEWGILPDPKAHEKK